MKNGRNQVAVSKTPSGKLARIVVAAPSPITPLGVRKILVDEPRPQIVAEVETMLLLLENIMVSAPEVAVVDWALAAQDPSLTATLIQPEFQKTSVVFLSPAEAPYETRAIFKLGAWAWVNKSASASELRTAVWKAAQRSVKDERVAAEKAVGSETSGPGERIRQLTSRERQLIPLVCGGMRNKAIGAQLGVAESTVWHHLTKVFTKLQVDDHLGLAAFAYAHGLVSPPETVRLGEPTSREL